MEKRYRFYGRKWLIELMRRVYGDNIDYSELKPIPNKRKRFEPQMGMIADKLPRTFDRGTMCSIGHSRFFDIEQVSIGTAHAHLYIETTTTQHIVLDKIDAQSRWKHCIRYRHNSPVIGGEMSRDIVYKGISKG
jgi:hypothetical protein